MVVFFSIPLCLFCSFIDLQRLESFAPRRSKMSTGEAISWKPEAPWGELTPVLVFDGKCAEAMQMYQVSPPLLPALCVQSRPADTRAQKLCLTLCKPDALSSQGASSLRPCWLAVNFGNFCCCLIDTFWRPL